VFVNRYHKPWTDWRTAFQNALKQAGIQNFRWHDLRHCFGSYLGMAGVNQNTMMELIGHKDPKMTLRYTHLSDEYKRQAVGRLPAIGDLESPQNPPSEKEPKVLNFSKWLILNYAKVAELADALDLGSSGATLEGSSPSFRIGNPLNTMSAGLRGTTGPRVGKQNAKH
jgi:hypothetical protein